MKQFNFSNPEVKISNEKKQSSFSSLVKTISAVIGLAEGLGSAALPLPKKIKDKLNPKEREKIARIFILLALWLIGAGIFETGNLILQLLKYIF